MTDDEVQSNRWHWIKIRWGTYPHMTDLIPGLPYRDQHGDVEFWETYIGRCWPGEPAPNEKSWHVVEIISVILDPPGY